MVDLERKVMLSLGMRALSLPIPELTGAGNYGKLIKSMTHLRRNS